MLTNRERRLESENHVGEDIGSIRPAVRSDVEDSLVYALDECHRTGRLDPFRDWVRRYALDLHWPETLYLSVRHNDKIAWFFIHALTCDLRRMCFRWEHSANILWHHYKVAPGNGDQFLHV